MSNLPKMPREHDWPPTTSIPDPDVLIIYTGLMGFASHPDGFCEVGIHSKAPNHKLSITVLEISSDFSLQTKSQVQQVGIFHQLYQYVGEASAFPEDVIRIEVSKPLTSGVTFYQKDDAGRKGAGKWPPTSDENDFRWIIDFESDELYGKPLQKKPEVFRPTLIVKSGVFITGSTTGNNKFWLKTPYVETEMREVGFCVVTCIDLKPGGFVAMRIGAQEVRLNQGKKNIILVDNACPQEVCDYKPTSQVKEKRNDFYLYYEAFKLPDYEEEYELYGPVNASEEQGEASAPETTGQRLAGLEELLAQLGIIFQSDETPCSAIGFGSGGGLGHP